MTTATSKDLLAEIRDMAARGMSPTAIAQGVGKTTSAIRNICDRHNIVLAQRSLESVVEQDLKFKRAMLAARKAGTEKVEVGVYKAKSNEQFSPRHFDRGAAGSGCGSPAAECAAQGD